MKKRKNITPGLESVFRPGLEQSVNGIPALPDYTVKTQRNYHINHKE
jgi:hypothetical protein